MSAQTEIREAGRLWAIRVQDPAFDDWDGYTAWLEADPAHLAAYEAALDDSDWGAALLASAPVEVAAEPQARRWWLPAGAAAAAAIAAVGGWSVIDRDAPAQQIATAPGEQRMIDLADGSKLALNGATRVILDPDTPRHVVLEQGEARFDVVHDASDPFVVMAGGTRLVDAGTVFNVVQDGDALQVAVSEGAVIYAPGPDEVRLAPGDTLTRDAKGAKPVVGKASTQAIGSWASGALHYDNASLGQVARDLSRSLGKPVRPAPGTEARTLGGGTLMLGGSPDQVLARAGPLLGVRFVAEGEGWTMSPADGPPR
ncbi:FecR domain-containing protein [Sphingomonas sp. HF-S4]|uniref:FecR domain-containing protein n=1 Tax=Sphingomonas agrestis TaxID=3080540 RepID=A0ABU3Y9J4_9SPHN|nr:FecR domain-containing protein [Sphingomonas sp. HF-S4]MDV3457838.1 FecR domain-containing protein [Sphingomonas sp. HF-S4]